MILSYAQLPNAKQSEEMRQMIIELKKEIAVLETEIKKAEKEDAESVPMLKTQLNSLKSMLAAFDKSKTAPVNQKVSGQAVKKKLPQATSPLTPVQLKVPVVTPTVAQAKDYFFWYKGKKINDSTLVTTKKTVIQYSRKRDLLIIMPDERKDSFVSIAKEISRNEQRKHELVGQFDKAKNGFMYYPYITTSLAIYDDLAHRNSEAVKNTISFDAVSFKNKAFNSADKPFSIAKGPNSDLENIDNFKNHNFLNGLDWVLNQLNDALKKWNQLPSFQDFPAPPTQDFGRCATCDTSAISRKRKLDEQWTEAYQAKENDILRQALSAMREYQLLGIEEGTEEVNEKFQTLFGLFNERLEKKDALLLERYGDKLQYLPAIIPVILGHERQRQLLGAGEESLIGDIVGKMYAAYRKYYDEQVAARNHDFVLNIPFHLGIYRQLALLGGETMVTSAPDLLEELMAYNRFALTMEMDFVWQADADGKLQRRATGNMETKEKIYILLYPDSCSYRILAHGTDLNNKQFRDITLPMKVKGGVETIREEEDKLVDYPYTGAPEYSFRFPDSKISLCDNQPDTLFLAIIGGDEEVAARGGADLQNMNKSYTIEMLIFANQALINENSTEMAEGTIEAGNQIINTISSFINPAPPANTLDKIKTQYTSYIEMDNQRKLLENAYSTKSARIVFNAVNRSSVLTDTYLDTKRKMEDGVEIKRGLFHLRMVHEPKEK